LQLASDGFDVFFPFLLHETKDEIGIERKMNIYKGMWISCQTRQKTRWDYDGKGNHSRNHAVFEVCAGMLLLEGARRHVRHSRFAGHYLLH
jgi:hypothetical protein